MSKRTDDAAKRVSDEYNMHRVADPYGSIGKWFAAKLTDGSCDHTLYESKADAVRHQHHNEQYYAFVQIGPWSMSPKDAAAFLALHRRMYSAGLRLADRDEKNGGRDVIRRLTRTDQKTMERAMFIGDVAPSNLIIPN